MRRYLEEQVRKDLDDKIVLLSGPRQSGKTTLSRMLFERHGYFNHDLADHRLAMARRDWDRDLDLVVFDELHKKRGWKSWLKGIYDLEGARPRLLATGSARLDIRRRVGDSMAGRFFSHRLHPLDLSEIAGEMPPEEALDTITRVGGFPAPFLSGSERFYKRWSRSHLDVILRQDLMDLDSVRDIQGMETLVELLKHRVGEPVSMSSLARDLERDSKTVKRWVAVLEGLYVVFRVTPYSRDIARSLIKEPKIYFYDTGIVAGDEGARIENVVATALRKELDRIEDAEGDRTLLHYLRTKAGREVDFATVVDGSVTAIIEAKSGPDGDVRNLVHFSRALPRARSILLVRRPPRERTLPEGTEVRDLAKWLSGKGGPSASSLRTLRGGR